MVAPRQVVIVIPIAAALGREKKKHPLRLRSDAVMTNVISLSSQFILPTADWLIIPSFVRSIC